MATTYFSTIAYFVLSWLGCQSKELKWTVTVGWRDKVEYNNKVVASKYTGH